MNLTRERGILATSPHSDDVVPHLSERDARLLVNKVTERLRALGVLPTRIGVSLDYDGFWFAAQIQGKEAGARFGQGNFTYDQVARDLVLASTDPGWNRLVIEKGS